MLRRWIRSLGLVLVVQALVLGVFASARQADDPVVADQVEEDWEVVVGDPDPDSTGPQITTCMTPVSGSTAFVAFCLNYRDDPTWQPGGLQIKAYGETDATTKERPLLVSSSSNEESLETSGETIAWTQRIGVADGKISYAVVNGASTTWGSFGQDPGSLAVDYSASISDLGSYSPDDSVKLSAAGWQANRVTSMRLLRVRYYKGGNLISTDDEPRSVGLTGATP